MYAQSTNKANTVLPPGFVMRSISDGSRRPAQQTSPCPVRRSDAPEQSSEAIPNLGILRTLNSGYDFTKRNLGMLATKISTITAPASGPTAEAELNSPSESRRLVEEVSLNDLICHLFGACRYTERTMTIGDFYCSMNRRIFSRDQDNEEDTMDEVISFDDTNTAQRSRHILDNASQSQQQQSSSANGATTSSTHVLI